VATKRGLRDYGRQVIAIGRVKKGEGKKEKLVDLRRRKKKTSCVSRGNTRDFSYSRNEDYKEGRNSKRKRRARESPGLRRGLWTRCKEKKLVST